MIKERQPVSGLQVKRLSRETRFEGASALVSLRGSVTTADNFTFVPVAKDPKNYKVVIITPELQIRTIDLAFREVYQIGDLQFSAGKVYNGNPDMIIFNFNKEILRA